MSNISTAHMIDELGYIKAQIAELETEKKALEAKLRKRLVAGEAAEGDLFRVVRIHQDTTHIDWKNIALRYEPSRQLITSHSKPVEKDYFKVSSRRNNNTKVA